MSPRYFLFLRLVFRAWCSSTFSEIAGNPLVFLVLVDVSVVSWAGSLAPYKRLFPHGGLSRDEVIYKRPLLYVINVCRLGVSWVKGTTPTKMAQCHLVACCDDADRDVEVVVMRRSRTVALHGSPNSHKTFCSKAFNEECVFILPGSVNVPEFGG